MAQPQDTVGILTDRMGRMVCTHCGAELDIGEFTLFERILCPSCESEEVVPGKLGNFLLLDQLGAGGMGAVYLAQDQTLRRRVALKVMRQEFGQNPQFNDSFMREAQATAKLNDPNVVQIYSFGQEKGQPYIVMELVDGGRLDKMMHGGNRLDELFILETAMGVAAGLSKAHENGIVHGDIKPANILYDKEDRPKVVDFGLAKFMEESAPSGEIWGTPFYIAPEKVRKKREDERSDQYCLGATLWHALAGRPPFDGKSAKDVVLARLDRKAENLHELDPEISEETANIIARMMQRKPSLRYPTYKSLQADLGTAIEHVKSRRASANAARIAAAQKPKSNIARNLISLGVVGALTMALAYIFIIKPNQEKKKADRDRKHIITATNPGDNGGGSQVRRTGRTYDDPLSKVERRMLAEAAQSYAAGNTLEGDTTLAKMRTSNIKYTDENHVSRYWVSLIQGVTAVLLNQPQLMKDYLDPVKDAKIDFDRDQEPVETPQLLARALLGELDQEAVTAQTKDAASWFTDLAGMIVGLKDIQAGRAEEGLAAMAAYADRKNTDPEWAYALQPIVKSLRDEHEEIQALLPAEGIEPDLKKIEEYYNTGFPIWKAVLDPYLKKLAQQRADQLAAQQEKQRQEAERLKAEKMAAEAAKKEAARAAEQEEVTRVEEAITAANTAAAGKDFAGALAQLDAVGSELKLDAAKKLLTPARERMERKANTKGFLIETINSGPYQGDAIMRGRPAKAAQEWLGIKSGNRAVKVPWDKLPEVEFAKLGSSCIENGLDNPEKQAYHAIGMALFFYDHGNRGIAGKFADKAAGYNPKSKSTITKLMPNIP